MTDWLDRALARKTVIFADPSWEEQTAAMDRGERARGDYDPPVPEHLVDALRGRWERMEALEGLMVAQGRADVPEAAEQATWADSATLPGRLAARLLDKGIRWVPATLLAEYAALYATAAAPADHA